MTEKPELLNNQAIMLAADGSYVEAIACFKRAITLDKDNYLLWFNLGVTYRDNGELQKAKEALSQAYRLESYNDDVAESYATVTLMLKQYDEALAICQDYLFDVPLASHLWNIMGVVYFQTKKLEDAQDCFEEAVCINPYYTDAIYNLMDTYHELNNYNGEAECRNKLKELGEK